MKAIRNQSILLQIDYHPVSAIRNQVQERRRATYLLSILAEKVTISYSTLGATSLCRHVLNVPAEYSGEQYHYPTRVLRNQSILTTREVTEEHINPFTFHTSVPSCTNLILIMQDHGSSCNLLTATSTRRSAI